MQKPIRIINRNFDLLGEISNYESLMFTRSWSGIGTLEMRVNRYKKYADQLEKGNIVFPFNELHKVYIILHREIELDENGKATENWLIRALELKVITGRRITIPPAHTSHDNKQAHAEAVMKHYINNNVINPVDVKRKIQQLVLAADQGRGINISWQSRFKNLAEELTEISLLSGLGWNIRLDYISKCFVFDAQQGRDLTASQSMNSPVIFSPQFDSIKNLSYVQSELNYKNMAYVAGQGEGVERRVIALHDNISGLDRHELFIDARDIAEETDDDPPQQRPVGDIIADLTNRGQQQLQEFLQEEYLEGQILTKSPFVYEKNYDLGDIVTLQSKDWGVTLDSRITEIKEIYEAGTGMQIEATFGNNRPTLINKIKQELAQMSGEVRK